MKIKTGFILFITLLNSFQGKTQGRIAINIPTADSEAEYIWRTIQDINFFEENNYQISLPDGVLIEELKEKAKSGNLENGDYERLKLLMQDSVYNKVDYQKGYDKIASELELIEKMIKEISQANYPWDFKEFETYEVNLTLYGPGGSYDPDEGSILIFTTPNGQFKSYENPANTIIHEVTHIGVEEAIIGKYQVPHALKERIVDTFVFLNFSQHLPDYRVQDMGEKRIDHYIKSKKDLRDLNKFVAEIMEKN